MLYFIKLLKILIHTKIEFKFPKKREILLFDAEGNNSAQKILKNNEYTIFHARNEKFNFFILIKCIVKFYFKFNFLKYAQTYLEFVDPKIVITFIDNNYSFYLLNKKKYKSIVIQRGNRSYHNDILEKFKKNKDKFTVDYFFVFNNSYAEHLKKYIKSNYLLLGSPLSNLVNIKQTKKNGICYVSTFSMDTYKYAKKNKNFYEKYYQSELIFLKKFSNFLKSKKIKFYILGKFKNKISQKIEKEFYTKELNNFKYIVNSKKRNTFSLLHKFKMIIGISSTLNLESFGRNIKTFFISQRLSNYPFNTKRFGYFANLKKNGICWSSTETNSIIIKKIMNLYKMNNKEWDLIYKKFNDISGCHYNYKNLKLINLIKLLKKN